MRWYLRKTQGSLNIPEYSDSQEPRRSILRSRTQNKEPCAEHDIGEASMVDLRSTVAGPRNSGVAKVNARLVANASVRSMDVGNRRNVLFLDEVQRSRKPCNYNHVFEDTSPGTSSFTPQPSLASYPTSYQASPVLSRRDDESDEIELVSRSPLPPTKPDEDSAVWIGTPIKQAFMNLSLSKRKRAKRERSLERQSIPMENGNINTAPMLDSVNTYPNVVQSVPEKQQARTKESNFLLRSSVTINSREINFKTIQPPTTSPPMVRRPMFPRVIEAVVSSTVQLLKCAELNV
ncbi:unnamed protein product [Dicrocoelium dendriticum]|nr:unnamed protein product [Dicrocoelium dendriticum]